MKKTRERNYRGILKSKNASYEYLIELQLIYIIKNMYVYDKNWEINFFHYCYHACNFILNFVMHFVILVPRLMYVKNDLYQQLFTIILSKKSFRLFSKCILFTLISMLMQNHRGSSMWNIPVMIYVRSNRQCPIKRSNLRHLHRVPCIPRSRFPSMENDNRRLNIRASRCRCSFHQS